MTISCSEIAKRKCVLPNLVLQFIVENHDHQIGCVCRMPHHESPRRTRIDPDECHILRCTPPPPTLINEDRSTLVVHHGLSSRTMAEAAIGQLHGSVGLSIIGIDIRINYYDRASSLSSLRHHHLSRSLSLSLSLSLESTIRCRGVGFFFGSKE
jgi:hypothetical protein